MNEPIAIVGRACVLPGALSPDALWEAVVGGRDLLTTVPEGRWGMEPRDVLCDGPDDSVDRTWSDRGGYVRGFDRIFDPEGFALPAADVLALDPVFQWTLHTAREALRDAGRGGQPTERVGAVFGNLSFPSAAMAAFTQAQAIAAVDGYGPEALKQAGLSSPDARNRFTSGLPALMLERALGLGVGAFALDAACASSLYAIELACDRLRDGTADVMLAGAVNCADDLCIHLGFAALQALSRSGRSRPFHRGADGLVPAEGCGFVALRRLTDAVRDGDTVHGIIRGIGLSNDGRSRGMLVPSADGQHRAIAEAFERAGLAPTDVSLLECHATGTQVGDATELEATARTYGDCTGLPIGSLKSNTGHLITAAGVAGLIKVIEAMRHGVRPPTLHVDAPLPALEQTPFRLLREAEPWDRDAIDSGVLRAGVSAFGFGGNNAHLIVEEAASAAKLVATSPWTGRGEGADAELAIVGVGVRAASARGRQQFVDALVSGRGCLDRSGRGSIDEVTLPLRGLRFPPNDLKAALAQQLSMMEVSGEALDDAGSVPGDATGVYVGMGTDPEAARFGVRWRLSSAARAWGCPPSWLQTARDGVGPPLDAAGVLGTMPNVVANRLNSQYDLAGPSFTVSAEEHSGLEALEVAGRALRAGRIDAAVVGAVDLSCDPAHEAAARARLPSGRHPSGDAAVALVLKRREDAERDGDPIYATLSATRDAGTADAAAGMRLGVGCGDVVELTPQFGHAHAASGLLHVAAAALLLRRGVRAGGEGLNPGTDSTASITVHAMDGIVARRVVLARAGADPDTADVAGAAAAAPSLSVPAHRGVIRLPPRPEAVRPAAAASDAYQDMPAAPVLPPVRWRPVATRPAEVIPGPPAAASARPAFQVAGGRVAARTVPAPNVIQHQVAVLAGAHGAFVAHQADVHAQFLALQRRMLASMTTERLPSVPLPAVRAPGAPADPSRQDASGSIAFHPTGPAWSREQLQIHASGRISELFGAAFAAQDVHARQCRMPEPPLLLADRVVGIDAEPGVLGKGTIWTETDVEAGAWYLNAGTMPAGFMIEAGQADLMLISYMGIDLLNQGQRVYRLLGCTLTYHGDLPSPGETLQYEIRINGHARHGDVRLFFFEYDCIVDGVRRLTVRDGQAGFFSEDELRDALGVLWTPEAARDELAPDPRLDAPAVECTKRAFSADDVAAFSEGRVLDCFGPGFEWTETHTRTPSIQAGDQLFIDSISELSPRGGPWGRGFMRCETAVHPDDWFFDGHFKNDPCMPGNFMVEACIEAMSFYLAAMGYTLERDGWRFQPLRGQAFDLKCRGEINPQTRHVTYELHVEQIWANPHPTLICDVLGFVDGRPAFHAHRAGVELVPGWPLTSRPEVYQAVVEKGPVATDAEGFPFDWKAMISCAWGRPSEAFGSMYAMFDGTRRAPRLPGAPYHFISRVTHIDGELDVCEPGMRIVAEYDIPQDAWYFSENGAAMMPFAVLLEAALQPCGWVASAVGSATQLDEDVMFRNLDGTGTLHHELTPRAGTLTTHVTITNVSRAAGMVIESFEVQCFLGDVCVYTMDTVFGFFPPEAFHKQVGLPIGDEDSVLIDAPIDAYVDLAARPPQFCEGPVRLAAPMLCMLDRAAVIPGGGAAGLGAVRGEKDVDVSEWFFKAHFFQDPVQPGSLGIEALLQLLQFFMLETGMAADVADGRFEPIALGAPLTWKYRGQVTPRNSRITTTMELTEVGRDDRGPFVIGKGSLWVDGLRIYAVSNMGMRIVSPAAARA